MTAATIRPLQQVSKTSKGQCFLDIPSFTLYIAWRFGPRTRAQTSVDCSRRRDTATMTLRRPEAGYCWCWCLYILVLWLETCVCCRLIVCCFVLYIVECMNNLCCLAHTYRSRLQRDTMCLPLLCEDRQPTKTMKIREAIKSPYTKPLYPQVRLQMTGRGPLVREGPGSKRTIDHKVFCNSAEEALDRTVLLFSWG